MRLTDSKIRRFEDSGYSDLNLTICNLVIFKSKKKGGDLNVSKKSDSTD